MRHNRGVCGSLCTLFTAGGYYILLSFTAHHNVQCIFRQRPLQRRSLIPWRSHPNVMFFCSRQNHWHRLWMNRLNDRVRRRRQETVDQVRTRDGLDLVPRSPLNSVQMPAKANRGRSASSANQTTSFFLVAGFGSGAYSAKLFAGTRQRLSGRSQPRQCGDDVLRMFVTGYPPARGGGGMPHRIIVSSRSAPALRITGAG
jgi:hypothetical protein